MSSFQYMGILSIMLAWIAICLVLYKWPIIISQSISKHVSANKQSYLLFAGIITISYLLFYTFAIKWLIPVYDLPQIFNALLILGLIFELIAAWVPDTGHLRHWVHHYLAYIAALFLPVLTGLIAASPKATGITKFISITAVIFMVTTFSLFLFIIRARERHLIYQSIYVASFHFAILVTILSVK